MRSAAAAALTLLLAGLLPCGAGAQDQLKWVTAWAASSQGPYPSGNVMLQPDLHQVFPAPEIGARDQSFRLIVGPDVWGEQARIRLSNAFGTKPVTFDGVFAGLQLGSSAVAPGTNQPVTFGGAGSVTIEPGASAWSDPIRVNFVKDARTIDLQGRKLAVSFHISGESGPMTWHAKALTTSYVSGPGTGSLGAGEDESAFPFATTSWYFLDALDMRVPADTKLIVALGDSLTDGTGSTLNAEDRWPDVLSRRLHAKFGNKFSVVNAGIGGNQVTGPSDYSPQKPFPGGPSAIERLERDVLTLSGVSAVIWFEGINDFSKNGNASAEAVIRAFRDGAESIRKQIPRVKLVGATVTTAMGNSGPAHGFAEQDIKRQALNDFIRGSGLFDAVIDFDKVISNPETGEMRPDYVPDSVGGLGDKLHPNRAGYLAMGKAIDLNLFAEPPS
jgi:lysophospholipase L1-like esterase